MQESLPLKIVQADNTTPEKIKESFGMHDFKRFFSYITLELGLRDKALREQKDFDPHNLYQAIENIPTIENYIHDVSVSDNKNLYDQIVYAQTHQHDKIEQLQEIIQRLKKEKDISVIKEIMKELGVLFNA